MTSGTTFQTMLPSLLVAAAIIGITWLVLWAAKRAIRRATAAMRQAGLSEEAEGWAHRITQFVGRSLELGAVLAAVIVLLHGLGVPGVRRVRGEEVMGWIVGPGARILLILFVAFVLTRALHFLIENLHVLLLAGDGPRLDLEERKKRVNTIARLLQIAASVIVFGIAGLMALKEVHVDITPILTGAGIAGLAVGFGAQNLVRDLISGFFMILENQVRVGDVAEINGKGGLVEAIQLRTIVLRSLDGTVHVIPNGAITELSNLTKDFSYYVMDVPIGYDEDVDRVIEVLKATAAELQEHPDYVFSILEPLEVLGVDGFAESSVTIKVRIKTAPIQQWRVGRELRRRVKQAFDVQGIQIPFPHRTLLLRQEGPPLPVQIVGSRQADDHDPQPRRE